MNPIDPHEAPPGWHAIEPPARFRAGENLTGACIGCGVHEANAQRGICIAMSPQRCPCLPKNRADGRFVHFERGPCVYGNEED